jgi:dTDP-6-deoxy-L-talose 4-dehydrogenase (NAD+)
MTLSQLFNAERVQFSWCRLFYLYGEGEHDKRLIPYIHKKLANSEPVHLTKGDQIRDFINVNEAGRLIAETSLNSSIGPVNICSGIPITVREIAEKIADDYGRRDLLKFGARPENYTDPPCVVGLV